MVPKVTEQVFDNPTGLDAPPNVNQPGSDFVTSEGGFGYEGIPRLKSDEDYEKVKPEGHSKELLADIETLKGSAKTKG